MEIQTREMNEADLRAVVRLLGEAAALPSGFLGKKCYILDGLCDFAGATEWRWAHFSKGENDGGAKCIEGLRRKMGAVDAAPLALGWETSESPHAPHVIISRRTLENGVESRIALCRDGSRPYTDRESHLALLVLDEIPWLHWSDWRTRPAAPRLAPRQQLTLDLLLLGLGAKEIAAQIGISSGTVSSYIRELYRHFGVNSQAELMRGHAERTLQQ